MVRNVGDPFEFTGEGAAFSLQDWRTLVRGRPPKAESAGFQCQGCHGDMYELAVSLNRPWIVATCVECGRQEAYQLGEAGSGEEEAKQ